MTRAVALIVVLAGASGARADALAPGERGVGYSFEVRSEAGPEWTVLLFPYGTSGGAPDDPELLQVASGQAYGAGRWHAPRFHAIRTADLSAVTALRGAALQQFLDGDPRVARGPGDLRIQSIRTAPASSGITAYRDVYVVRAVEGGAVRVELEARHVTYDGGRTEVMPRGQPAGDSPAAPAAGGSGTGAAATSGGGDDCSVSSVRPERIGILLVLLAAGAVLVYRARRSRR